MGKSTEEKKTKALSESIIYRFFTDGGIILTVYICILIAGLSFFAPSGYYGLGESKFFIFRIIACTFSILLIPAMATRIMDLKKAYDASASDLLSLIPFTVTDIALTAMALLLTWSFAFSYDRKLSLWGIDGWRMGYLTYIIIFAGYLFCRCIDISPYLRYVFLTSEIVSSLVFILGILNRMGIYPFPSMISTDTSFLSTIGNINWYSGYLALFICIGIADLVIHSNIRILHKGRAVNRMPQQKGKKNAHGSSHKFTIDSRSLLRIIPAHLCVFTGFFTMISMGSNTTLLILLVTVMILTALTLTGNLRIRIFLIMVSELFLALEIYGIMLLDPTSTYTYSTDVIWLKLAVKHTGAIGLILCALLFTGGYFLYRKRSIKLTGNWESDSTALVKITKISGIKKKTGALILYILPALFIVMIFVIILLTAPVALSRIIDLIHYNLHIKLTDAWGNGRGIIYRISGLYIHRLPILRLIFGTGPDCFYPCALADEKISAMLYGTFGDMRLTNSHCILLTALIEKGIPYVIALIAFTVSAYYSLVFAITKNDKSDVRYALTGCLILTAVCTVYIFAFPTTVSLPFLLMVTGLTVRRGRE